MELKTQEERALWPQFLAVAVSFYAAGATEPLSNDRLRYLGLIEFLAEEFLEHWRKHGGGF